MQATTSYTRPSRTRSLYDDHVDNNSSSDKDEMEDCCLLNQSQHGQVPAFEAMFDVPDYWKEEDEAPATPTSIWKKGGPATTTRTHSPPRAAITMSSSCSSTSNPGNHHHHHHNNNNNHHHDNYIHHPSKSGATPSSPWKMKENLYRSGSSRVSPLPASRSQSPLVDALRPYAPWVPPSPPPPPTYGPGAPVFRCHNVTCALDQCRQFREKGECFVSPQASLIDRLLNRVEIHQRSASQSLLDKDEVNDNLQQQYKADTKLFARSFYRRPASQHEELRHATDRHSVAGNEWGRDYHEFHHLVAPADRLSTFSSSPRLSKQQHPQRQDDTSSSSSPNTKMLPLHRPPRTPSPETRSLPPCSPQSAAARAKAQFQSRRPDGRHRRAQSPCSARTFSFSSAPQQQTTGSIAGTSTSRSSSWMEMAQEITSALCSSTAYRPKSTSTAFRPTATGTKPPIVPPPPTTRTTTPGRDRERHVLPLREVAARHLSSSPITTPVMVKARLTEMKVGALGGSVSHQQQHCHRCLYVPGEPVVRCAWCRQNGSSTGRRSYYQDPVPVLNPRVDLFEI